MSEPDRKAAPPTLKYHRFNPAPDRVRRAVVHAVFLALRAIPAMFFVVIAIGTCLKATDPVQIATGVLAAGLAVLCSVRLVRPFKTLLEAAKGKYVDPY